MCLSSLFWWHNVIFKTDVSINAICENWKWNNQMKKVGLCNISHSTWCEMTKTWGEKKRKRNDNELPGLFFSFSICCVMSTCCFSNWYANLACSSCNQNVSLCSKCNIRSQKSISSIQRKSYIEKHKNMGVEMPFPMLGGTGWSLVNITEPSGRHLISQKPYLCMTVTANIKP